MIIENGVGDGTKAGVNKNNQLQTFSVTEDEAQSAAQKGNAYNINTGSIAFSANSTTRTSLLYFKNDEDTDFVITAIALGLGTRTATISDAANVFLVRNPTAGDIIDSTPANVDINSNNNFGSNKTLKSTSLAYKGADGDGATTGGSDHALLYMTDGRLFATLNIDMPKGSSIAIEFDGNTSGAFNVYAALVGYVKDASL
jgi:hypothetical protein